MSLNRRCQIGRGFSDALQFGIIGRVCWIGRAVEEKVMAKLTRFEIRPVDDETVRMTVKDSDGLQWSADLSYPVLVDLTRSMPRYLK